MLNLPATLSVIHITAPSCSERTTASVFVTGSRAERLWARDPSLERSPVRLVGTLRSSLAREHRPKAK
jgi:hypothetical protein